jgi:hypothetical protein
MRSRRFIPLLLFVCYCLPLCADTYTVPVDTSGNVHSVVLQRWRDAEGNINPLVSNVVFQEGTFSFQPFMADTFSGFTSAPGYQPNSLSSADFEGCCSSIRWLLEIHLDGNWTLIATNTNLFVPNMTQFTTQPIQFTFGTVDGLRLSSCGVTQVDLVPRPEGGCDHGVYKEWSDLNANFAATETPEPGTVTFVGTCALPLLTLSRRRRSNVR